jgi:hypothetical protein
MAADQPQADQVTTQPHDDARANRRAVVEECTTVVERGRGWVHTHDRYTIEAPRRRR